jgi:hypothetical protein
MAINAKQVIPRPVVPFEHWADYPGFEVDEEAVYITANMFTFVPFGSFGGSRVWIVRKGVGAGGFYDGGPGTFTVRNPYAGGGLATTTMPAFVQGPGGAGPSVGTYLVSYSGIFNPTTGIEFVQVVRVSDPLGGAAGPFFARALVPVGDIETPGSLPGAPQFGSPVTISTNDRRALDAVWQNNRLWLTTTIRPNSGPDLNQTTAHWFELDTSVGVATLVQQGDIGGEDIAPGSYTFFPSVALNRCAAAFGFSASAPTIYAGAFVTGRSPFDAPGTVRASELVQAGLAPYVRTFGGGRNRWGDYTGIATDPSNNDFYWVFNQYASSLRAGRWSCCVLQERRNEERHAARRKVDPKTRPADPSGPADRR